ncbi:MAG: dienelactone hydrolase family protein [Alphaproteobacteria bacterium]|nr:dienelactone hydrolase family protein [Alphaproteobacteria bacterium]
MDQRIIDLYSEYTLKPLPRRVFLDRLARLVGGSAAALALLPMLESNYALAQMVPEGDARLEASMVGYPGPAGEVKAYLARPKGMSGKAGAVIVIHENRGLTPHIRDVVRRVALEGFVALGTDLLARQGGTPSNEDQAREMFTKIDAAGAVADLVAAVGFMKARADVNGKVASVGYCWGGGMSNQIAVNAPDLAAAVAFYGPVPASDQVGKIKARMLLHYASTDNFINPKVPEFEDALKAAGIRYIRHDYPDTQHAFHNDTAGARYSEPAAKLAWGRTVAFFKEILAG